MRRIILALIPGILISIQAAPLHAGGPTETRTVLSVRHVDSFVDTLTPSGRVKATTGLAETMNFEIEPNETFVIQVKDCNPLLFNYSLKAIEKTDTENFKEIQKFLGSAKDLLAALGKIAPAAAGKALALKQATGLTPFTPEEKVKKALWDFSEHLRTLVNRIEESREQIEKSAQDSKAAEEVKSTVGSWGITELLGQLDGDLNTLDAFGLQLAANRGALEPGGQTLPPDLVASVTQAQVQETKVRSMMQALKTFADQAAKIHTCSPLEPTIAFDPIHNGGATLEIAAVKGREEAAAKAGLKTGKFNFIVKPYSPVSLSVGPAAIYSFIETENFGTKTENGKIHIVRTDSGNQVNGLTVGAMLSIIPRAWSNPAFRGSIQVGASPVKDKIGLFLGGGVQFFNQLSIGGGIAYQQAQRLAKGLAVGQEIASEDKLKTNIVFKSGFYLTVTLDFGGKK